MLCVPAVVPVGCVGVHFPYNSKGKIAIFSYQDIKNDHMKNSASLQPKVSQTPHGLAQTFFLAENPYISFWNLKKSY